VREIIVVEGRYDKNAVSQAVDAMIIETRGFGAFRDTELLPLLRRLGAARGIVIMTDGDGAGFMIRGHLGGALDGQGGIDVKHAYIPDTPGRERRKRRDSAAGLLGVEGMPPAAIIKALRDCGATFVDESGDAASRKNVASDAASGGITATDLYTLGLAGAENAAARRARLLQRLELPALLKTNALLRAVNALYTREEFFEIAGEG
jgi:ribonuclease M5